MIRVKTASPVEKLHDLARARKGPGNMCLRRQIHEVARAWQASTLVTSTIVPIDRQERQKKGADVFSYFLIAESIEIGAKPNDRLRLFISMTRSVKAGLAVSHRTSNANRLRPLV